LSLTILTKCNGGSKWGSIPGGLSEYPSDIVSASLGLRDWKGRRLPEECVITARALLGLCNRAPVDLQNVIALKFARKFSELGWRRYKPAQENVSNEQFCRKVGLLVAFNYLGGYNCPSCIGMPTKAKSECRRCGGNGKGEFTNAKKARILGITPDSYARVWRDRVQEVYSLPQTWEDRAARHVGYQLEMGAVR
jgi:hypothetical protein